MVKLFRDKYELEGHVGKSNFKTASYSKATQLASEMLLEELLEGVMEELN